MATVGEQESRRSNDIPNRSVRLEMNYDKILENLGPMGKFQLRTFLWLCLPAFFPGIVIMSQTFTASPLEFRCLMATALHSEKELNQTRVECCTLVNDSVTEKSHHWVYNHSVFHSTIVSDFHLVCENKWKQTATSTLFMLGMLLGALTIGVIGDIVGRKMTYTLNVFLLALTTTASAFSPDWITFCVLRFLSGIGACGHFLIVFVWGVEVVGKKYRILCGFVYQIFFAIGTCCLGIVAYFVRDWRLLQFIISVPMFGLAALFWILPESIRWLIAKQNFYQAKQLILEAANVNGISLPDEVSSSLDGSPKNKSTGISTIVLKSVANSSNRMTDEKQKSKVIDLFRSKTLITNVIVMSLAWVAGVMSYFGITYATTDLSTNIYVNFELSVLIEIPAYILAMVVVEKIGRRPMLIGGLISSGVGCLVTVFIPQDCSVTQTAFSLVGKLFISCVIATLFSYTSELFPTSIRSAMIGLCSTSGRLGGILAPIISDWGSKSDDRSLPFLVFAFVNISVGVLCFLLPETRNTPLPSNIAEASALKTKRVNTANQPFNDPH